MMWSFGASPTKEPQASAGKIGGNLQAPPPDKVDNENCQHNVLAKYVRENKEIIYRCMKCSKIFKITEELQTQFQGGTK